MPNDVCLFITCLVDIFFPRVGESMVEVLRRLGMTPAFPEGQTCCGQPALNSGYRDDAATLAKRFIGIFNAPEYEDSYIVTPSGSCATMVKVFYPELFRDDPEMSAAAEALSARTYEFSSFITEVLHVEDVGASYEGVVTYHDSCHTLRELGIKDPPRRLIRSVRGVELREMKMHDACCGFGGTFSVKYPGVSASMLEEKIGSMVETGADTVVSTDMGCLMQIKGAASRRGLSLTVMHLAELLAMK